MAVRDILVCVDPTTAGATRLQIAFHLARESKAFLAAGYVFREEHRAPGGSGLLTIPSDGVIGVAGRGAERAGGEVPAAALEESAEQQFRKELGEYGLDGEWHVFASGETDRLTELAKSFDLTVLGQLAPGISTRGAIRPEHVVVAAGRPVLVIPYAGRITSVGKRALVAWDGSREAVRALNDALPLLTVAEAVTVMLVGSQAGALERQKPSIERVIRHLRHHGIEAKLEETLRGDIPVSDILLSRASDLDTDLIVAGAYHHSQLREALVGGVSRDLLDHMTVPVLMSH